MEHDQELELDYSHDVSYPDLIQDKSDEIEIKMNIMKQNIMEIRREIEKGSENLKEIKAKYVAAKEIEELRNYQRNSLHGEITSSKVNEETLVSTVNFLQKEVKKIFNS